MAAAQLVLTDLDWSELHFYLLSLFSHYHSTDVAVVLRSHCNNLGYHLCPVDPDKRLEFLCDLWKSLDDGLDRNSCDRCLRILVHYLNVYKILIKTVENQIKRTLIFLPKKISRSFSSFFPMFFENTSFV